MLFEIFFNILFLNKHFLYLSHNFIRIICITSKETCTHTFLLCIDKLTSLFYLNWHFIQHFTDISSWICFSLLLLYNSMYVFENCLSVCMTDYKCCCVLIIHSMQICIHVYVCVFFFHMYLCLFMNYTFECIFMCLFLHK